VTVKQKPYTVESAEALLRDSGFTESQIDHLLREELKGQKQCRHCGQAIEFTLGKRHHFLYCSRQCQQSAANAKTKQQRASQAMT
jgi:hypothetical protein